MSNVTKVCDGCRGSGELVFRSNLRRTQDHGACPTCSGTGRVPFDAAAEWDKYDTPQTHAMLDLVCQKIWEASGERADLIWQIMPPDIRLAMAKAAPKVAGPWQMSGGGGVVRLNRDGLVVAAALFEASKAQEDTRLTAAGWLLEGETP